MRSRIAVLHATAAVVVACGSTVTPLPPRSAAPAPERPTDAVAAVPSLPGAAAVLRTPASGTIGSSGLTPHHSAVDDVVVRVAVGWRQQTVSFSSRAEWLIEWAGGGGTIARAAPGDVWTVQAVRSLLQVGSHNGPQHAPRGTTVILRPASADDAVLYAGKRYRGELRVFPTDTGLLVINRVGVEDYLRGVVPLEIGNRPAAERAAAEAQAITARSYVYVRVRSRRAAQYDILSDVREQVYGGVESERPATDAAVAATAGLGLFHAGELVDAPYHSTCGGATAAVSEVWQSRRDLPYLRAVSDRVPGSDRFWCDGSAAFRWTRTMSQADLQATLRRYLRQYVSSAPADPGVVRDLIEGPRTNSGRVSSVTVVTSRGRYVVRGNDARFVLRNPNEQVLNSTNFSVSASRTGSELRSVTLRGNGNGHGVGMCQWGAIGRARAGHTAEQILSTYYPGTAVARVDRSDLRSAQ